MAQAPVSLRRCLRLGSLRCGILQNFAIARAGKAVSKGTFGLGEEGRATRQPAAATWLRGEIEDARYAWARGNELAEKLPACGYSNFTRWQFAELRRVLDEGDAEPAKSAPETANSAETQEDGLTLSFGNRINNAP